MPKIYFTTKGSKPTQKELAMLAHFLVHTLGPSMPNIDLEHTGKYEYGPGSLDFEGGDMWITIEWVPWYKRLWRWLIRYNSDKDLLTSSPSHVTHYTQVQWVPGTEPVVVNEIDNRMVED